MNNNVVEKTLKSIDNIDRLSDLAAISIYNTSHEAIDKFDVMQEHATPEYVEGEFVQESLLTGVLIGAGIIGVAISAFLIIKKIIESKAKGDPNAAPNTVAGVNLLNPDEIKKLFDGWNDKYFKNHPDLVVEDVPGADVSELNAYNSMLLESIRKFCDDATKMIDGLNELSDADMKEAIDNLNKEFDSSINMDNLVSKTGKVDKDTILQIKAEAEGISKTLREFDMQVTNCIKEFRNKEKNNQSSDSDSEENKISEENIKLLEKALKAKANTAGAIMDNFRNKCLDGIAQALDAKVKELEAADANKEKTEAKEADLAKAREEAKDRAAAGVVDRSKVGYAEQMIRFGRKNNETDEEIKASLIEYGITEAEIAEAFKTAGENSNESKDTKIEADNTGGTGNGDGTGSESEEEFSDDSSDDSERAPIELNEDMKSIIVKACKKWDPTMPDNYANQYADIVVKNHDLNALRQHLNAGHTGEHKAEHDAQTEELIKAIHDALYDSLPAANDEASTKTENEEGIKTLTDAEKTELISELQSNMPEFNEYSFNRIYDNLTEGTAETIIKDIASQAFEELFDSANKINLHESGKIVNEILSKKYALYKFIAKKVNIDFSKFNVKQPDLTVLEFNQLAPIFDDVKAGNKTPYQGINEAIKIVLAKYGFDEESASPETPETENSNLEGTSPFDDTQVTPEKIENPSAEETTVTSETTEKADKVDITPEMEEEMKKVLLSAGEISQYGDVDESTVNHEIRQIKDIGLFNWTRSQYGDPNNVISERQDRCVKINTARYNAAYNLAEVMGIDPQLVPKPIPFEQKKVTEKKEETTSSEETAATPEVPKKEEQTETSSEESNDNEIKRISDTTGLDEGKVENIYKIFKDNSTPDDVKRAFIIDTISPIMHMPGFNEDMTNKSFAINYANFKKVAEAANIRFEIEQPEISEKDINNIHTIVDGAGTDETKLAKIADNLMNSISAEKKDETEKPENEILNTADTIENANQDQNKPPTRITNDDLIAAKNANINETIAELIAYSINNNKDITSGVVVPAMGTLLNDINERPLNSFEQSQYLKTYDDLVKAFNYFHLDPNQYLDPEKYPDPKSLGILSDEERAEQDQRNKWLVDLADKLFDHLSDNKTIAEFISDKKISEQDVADALNHIGMGDISVPIDENKVRRDMGISELKTQATTKAQPSSPSNSSTGSRAGSNQRPAAPKSGSKQQPVGKPVNKPESGSNKPAKKPGIIERFGQFLGF